MLAGFDRVRLAARAADVMEKFEKLGAGPVRVWNAPPPKGGVYPPTPTRAFRLRILSWRSVTYALLVVSL